MIRVILFLAACLSLSGPAFAEDLTPQKKADIEKLMTVTGAASLGKQMGVATVQQMTVVIRQMRPDIPQKVLDVLPGEVEAVFSANMDSFMTQVIPIYHKYFTGAEVKQMLAFYSTDLGKKTIKVMPALMAEGMAAGEQWGRSLGPAIEARVKARCEQEGYPL